MRFLRRPKKFGSLLIDRWNILAPIIGFNLLPDPSWARGGYYYGSSWSYYYSGPYYGGPYTDYAFRLPYVCGLYGYCF